MTQKKPTTTQNKSQSENGLGKFSESTDSYIDYEAQAEPLAKRVKCQKSIDDVPPCQRCTLLKRDAILPSVETYEDAEKPVENHIQISNHHPRKPQIQDPVQKLSSSTI